MNWHLRGAVVCEDARPDAEWIEGDVFIRDGRMVAGSSRSASIVDVTGYRLLPGLVNAHDHLELNHYPRTKYCDVYDNAHQWGSDVNARLDEEPFKSLRAYSLWDRLFIGGLKNLLCGATTVIQHGTAYRELFHRDYPVRVFKRYGWAHSLHFDAEEAIVRSYRRTPKDVPWFIHLAEGTDEVAGDEYERLKALGCVGANTVIVHGVGLREQDVVDAVGRVRGIVTCPTTNRYLLGAVGNIDAWREGGLRVTVGSDSRLTADGDLLDELCALGITMQAPTDWLIGDRLRWADLILLADGANLSRRANLALVMRGGVPMIGDADVMGRFEGVETVGARLDGIEKRLHAGLARLIQTCKIKEEGLDVDVVMGRRWWFW